MKRVNKKRPVNFKRQLKESLRELIREHLDEVDYCIPSEGELCRFHKLSRGTVRKAIEELAADNILIKRPGMGTFINPSEKEKILASNGGLIAFVTNLGMATYINQELARGIENTLSSYGYFMVMKSFTCANSEERVLSLLRRRCEGIILYMSGDKTMIPLLEKFDRENYPIVLVDRYFKEVDTAFSVNDDYEGAKMATEYLISKGLKRLFHVTFKSDISPVSNRKKGFADACLAAPGVFSKILELERDSAKSDTCITDIRDFLNEYSMTGESSGILANHSGLSRIIWKTAKSIGLKIPEDLALIGFGNDAFTEDLSLSAIDTPYYDEGVCAAEYLVAKIEKRYRKIMRKKLKPGLIERHSSSINYD